MNRRNVPYVVAGVAGVVIAGAVLLARSSAAAVDDGRAIHVAGDSYAVGVAGALRRLFPGRAITSDAKGGVAAFYMPTLKERDGWTILSAGTNDAAGTATPSDIADRIVRVLGPYGKCEAKRGGVAYLVPHSKMGGTLGDRVAMVRAELVSRGVDRLHCVAFVQMSPTPSPTDGIHFTPAGYETIARDAVQALAELG